MFYQDEKFGDSLKSRTTGPDSVSGKKLIQCGTCGRVFDVGSSPFRPFCSERCQQVDLGNWLNESYGLPFEDSTIPDNATGIEDDASD